MSTAFTLSRVWSWQSFVSEPSQPTEPEQSEPWNVLYHQGGNSPWIPKVHDIIDGGLDVPSGCRVEQVHMISRHAERYPTVLAGIRMLDLYYKIQYANGTLKGDLSFANDWEFLTKDPRAHFESLVSTGPFAGTLQAFTTGSKLRTRYKHLLDIAVKSDQTSLWASDSERVIDTARYFAAGFFGIDWKDIAILHVISETSDIGADTLTPGKTCLNFALNRDHYGHDYGARMLYEWRTKYLPPIIERLRKQNPSPVFTESEVYSMQELCGFETIAKGSSQWCDIFTHEEQESFEYARDLLHYYKSGSGNPYGATMGWLWLNATSTLLREGSSAGPLFFSFAHDGDIVPFLSALDLFPQSPELPTSHVLHNRTWRTSDVVPMGGRVILERLACPAPQHCWSNAPMYPNHVYCEALSDDIYVRINVNDGVVSLPDCHGGPGSSCPLDEFLYRTQRRGEEVGSFGDVCGLPDDAAKSITFLHQ